MDYTIDLYRQKSAPLHLTTILSSHEQDPSEYTARPENAISHSSHFYPTINPNQSNNDDNNPQISHGLSRPLVPEEQDRLAHLDRLKFFLATAPSHWKSDSTAPTIDSTSTVTFPSSSSSPNSSSSSSTHPHPLLHRFPLPTSEHVTCVLWGGLYHISGTDIVRALTFRFEAFGRPVRNVKKFEEGVFSDLRNLKPGIDACLEEPKSPFLDLLFKYQCIRTQKKQKVFYWFSVPHDRLFLDALERDLKREKAGLEPTTVVTGEPALSFTYDPKRSLYEQFSRPTTGRDDEASDFEAVADVDGLLPSTSTTDVLGEGGEQQQQESSDEDLEVLSRSGSIIGDQRHPNGHLPPALQGPNTPFFSFSLFEGSPTYKQRRKKGGKQGANGVYPMRKGSGDEERGRRINLTRYGFDREDMGPCTNGMDSGENDVDMDVSGLTAAEMFLKQARGELIPPSTGERRRLATTSAAANGMYAPRPQFPSHLQTTPQFATRPRSHDAMYRHTYPIPSSMPISFSAPYSTESFAEAHPSSLPTDGQMYSPPDNNNNLYAGDSSDGGMTMMKSKAFVCPLFSCSRLFKRMEHLKRHLRTHTMERPYECPTCYKKFSRSDNLNQHVRTHGRAGAGGHSGVNGASRDAGNVGSGSTTGDVGLDWECDPELDGSPNGGLESEGEDGLLMSNGSVHGDTASNGIVAGGSFGMDAIAADPSLCEVEIPGGVHDVHGDEEGLVTAFDSSPADVNGFTTNTSGFFTSSSANNNIAQPLPHHYDSTTAASSSFMDASSLSGGAQWASVRPHPSPAFSTLSAPSPPPGCIPHIRSGRSSLTSSPGSYLRNHSPTLFSTALNNSQAAAVAAQAAAAAAAAAHHSHSNSTGSHNNAVGGDFVTSMSAPSHKLAFDHAALYNAPSPNMLGLALGVDSPNNGQHPGGGGPIRRHRSMTPSLMRNGENVRRPMTTSSGGDFATTTTTTTTTANNRGYHPYASALPYATTAKTMSTQSSPSTYPVPLDYVSSTSGNTPPFDHQSVVASPPRSMSLGDVEGYSLTSSSSSSTSSSTVPPTPSPFGDMFRTDSPTPFQTHMFMSTSSSNNNNTVPSSSSHFNTEGFFHHHPQVLQTHHATM